MENLKRIIGLAPSEMEPEELLRKIRKRQEFVGSLLQRFREQTIKPPVKPAKERIPKGTKKAEAAALGELMKEMRDAGISMEEFRQIARGKEG